MKAKTCCICNRVMDDEYLLKEKSVYICTDCLKRLKDKHKQSVILKDKMRHYTLIFSYGSLLGATAVFVYFTITHLLL